MRLFKNPFLIFIAIIALHSCVKEEYTIDEDMSIPNLDPAFAAPLVSTTLKLEDLEQNLDYQNFIYSQNDELFVFAYNQEIFEYQVDNLIDLPNQSLDYAYEMDGATADGVNALSEGTSISYNFSDIIYLDLSNGEELDSVIFDLVQLELSLASQINQDVLIEYTLPTVTLDGVPFSESLSIEYSGTLPINESLNSELIDYTFDLTNGGSDTNALPIDYTLTFTKTSESVSAGDDINLSFDLALDDFHAIYGYFGQLMNVIEEDSQRVDLFEGLDGGILHFEDPSLNLTIYNEIGMDVEVDFNSVLAPDNNTTLALGGPDLTDIPTLLGANFPGDETITLHTIDNSGTSPSLSDLLDEGPSTLVYSATANTNPDGFTQNFAIDTSKIRFNAEVVLPLFLFADNFVYTDTLDVDLADALDLEADSTSFDESDIKRITLRLIADNGLPIDVGTQVYFADSMNVIVDSLFQNAGFQPILTSGLVDFSLPTSDPNYGRVLQSTQTINEIVLTQSMINRIVDDNATKVIFRAKALTSNAGNGEVVKFFPEYSLDLKLAAKIETDIN